MEPYWIETEDWHTAGEPFRIVPRLPAGFTPEGSTVSERHKLLVDTPNHTLDELRRTLCHEPRGHADMYGGFLLPANNNLGHLGVLFFHKDGFSTACGHGTIALGMYAISHGLVKAQENGTVDVIIDVPSGRVIARVHCMEGKPVGVDFINVASYPLHQGVEIRPKTSRNPITLDVAWGGAAYAYVDAAQLGLEISPENHLKFIDLGRDIKSVLGDKGSHRGYQLYGVCFYTNQDETLETIMVANVVVFADGQIDRSPCGSGTAAKIAILEAQGKLRGKQLIHRSIVGTEFRARVDNSKDLLDRAIQEDPSLSNYAYCIPSIYGSANLTGRHQFYIDPKDPIYPGFVFR